MKYEKYGTLSIYVKYKFGTRGFNPIKSGEKKFGKHHIQKVCGCSKWQQYKKIKKKLLEIQKFRIGTQLFLIELGQDQ